MSCCVSPWVYPVCNCLGFLDWVAISFTILGKFSTIISSIFSWPFFLSSSSGTPMIQMLGAFNIVPEVSEVVLISFKSFFFFPLCFIYFHHSIFHLTYPIFCLSYSTVGSLQSAFDLSYLIIRYWLTFLFLLGPC